MPFAGRKALVTGGSRGIGFNICKILLEHSVDVLAVSRNLNSLNDAKESLPELQILQGDVSIPADNDAIATWVTENWGELDILINNAGTTRFIDFPDLEAVTDEVWDRLFAVNLKGPFQCARAARAALAAGEGGVIVNTASVAGIAGAGSCIPYAASKAALINLTIALARTLGPTIRVNAVAPGFIEGDWLQRGLGADYEAARTAKAGESLLDSVSTPEDIAQGILGLIAADKVTGHTLAVDAGHTIGPRLAHGIK